MYGSIAGWRAYAAARGNTAPTAATDPEATSALVRGSDMVRLRYVANLLSAYDVDFTPDGWDLPLVEEASYIAASYELTTPGFFSRTFTDAERKVLVGVDKIRWQVTGKDGTYSNIPSSSLIDAIFFPYIVNPDRAGFLLQALG